MGLAALVAACDTKPPDFSEGYTIGGTAEGLAGPLELRLGEETLRVTQNGPFTFTTKLPKGNAYAVSVATPPQSQRCTVSNGSGTVGGNVEGLLVRCTHWFELTSAQSAKAVIGQVDFETSAAHQGETPDANTLDGPSGNPVFAGGRLYIADQDSNRVLGFTGVPSANNAQASLVLGQSNFTSTAPGSTQATLDGPVSLSSDGTRLAVADKNNSRVLLHTSLPASTGATPALVIGQPAFGDALAGCTRQALNSPEGVFIGHGKLLVADTANSRVLVWNSLPSTHGAPADLVLGQAGFTHCVENDANDDLTPEDTPSASTLWNPTGVWTDGTRLVVVDSYNNRVLLWNQFPTRNGQPADAVLGQPSFTSRAAATTASAMNTPVAVASTGLQLFVADHQNNRVLVWNQLPTTNGAAADLVLGQPDFTSAHMADPDSPGGNPSARSTYRPSGMLLNWPQVLVSDYGNNRVLVFESR